MYKMSTVKQNQFLYVLTQKKKKRKKKKLKKKKKLIRLAHVGQAHRSATSNKGDMRCVLWLD